LDGSQKIVRVEYAHDFDKDQASDMALSFLKHHFPSVAFSTDLFEMVPSVSLMG
jgi:hypothetical protein